MAAVGRAERLRHDHQLDRRGQHGPRRVDRLTRAPRKPLAPYAGARSPGLSAAETARVETRYDRAQLADAAITNGLQALGRLRFHEGSVETTIRNLEADAYADDPDLHTQIAVLNKINATGVTAARMAKDTNYVLVSLLEQQLLEATERREAAVQGINAHVAFLTEARPAVGPHDGGHHDRADHVSDSLARALDGRH